MSREHKPPCVLPPTPASPRTPHLRDLSWWQSAYQPRALWLNIGARGLVRLRRDHLRLFVVRFGIARMDWRPTARSRFANLASLAAAQPTAATVTPSCSAMLVIVNTRPEVKLGRDCDGNPGEP